MILVGAFFLILRAYSGSGRSELKFGRSLRCSVRLWRFCALLAQPCALTALLCTILGARGTLGVVVGKILVLGSFVYYLAQPMMV